MFFFILLCFTYCSFFISIVQTPNFISLENYEKLIQIAHGNNSQMILFPELSYENQTHYEEWNMNSNPYLENSINEKPIQYEISKLARLYEINVVFNLRGISNENCTEEELYCINGMVAYSVNLVFDTNGTIINEYIQRNPSSLFKPGKNNFVSNFTIQGITFYNYIGNDSLQFIPMSILQNIHVHKYILVSGGLNNDMYGLNQAAINTGISYAYDMTIFYSNIEISSSYGGGIYHKGKSLLFSSQEKESIVKTIDIDKLNLLSDTEIKQSNQNISITNQSNTSILIDNRELILFNETNKKIVKSFTGTNFTCLIDLKIRSLSNDYFLIGIIENMTTNDIYFYDQCGIWNCGPDPEKCTNGLLDFINSSTIVERSIINVLFEDKDILKNSVVIPAISGRLLSPTSYKSREYNLRKYYKGFSYSSRYDFVYIDQSEDSKYLQSNLIIRTHF